GGADLEPHAARQPALRRRGRPRAGDRRRRARGGSHRRPAPVARRIADAARRRRRPGLGRRGPAGTVGARAAAPAGAPGASRRALPRPRPRAAARAAGAGPRALARRHAALRHPRRRRDAELRARARRRERPHRRGRSAGAPRRAIGIALRGPARRRARRAHGPLGERDLAPPADGARPADRGGAVRSRADLDALAWPAERLGEAVSALARLSGLKPAKLDLAEPRELSADELDRWIGAAAAAMGLEAEPVETAYGEVEALVRQSAPALLRLPGGEPRFLLLLAGGWRAVRLLGPDLQPVRV